MLSGRRFEPDPGSTWTGFQTPEEVTEEGRSRGRSPGLDPEVVEVGLIPLQKDGPEGRRP